MVGGTKILSADLTILGQTSAPGGTPVDGAKILSADLTILRQTYPHSKSYSFNTPRDLGEYENEESNKRFENLKARETEGSGQFRYLSVSKIKK